MKRSKSGNKWQDHYTRQARKDKYPARSVYKLKEIQQKNRVINKGNAILDLGCAPGSWLKYAAEVAGPGGRVRTETIRKDREALIISEIPYQVNKARLIEKIAELMKHKVIEGLRFVRDESDRRALQAAER